MPFQQMSYDIDENVFIFCSVAAIFNFYFHQGFDILDIIPVKKQNTFTELQCSQFQTLLLFPSYILKGKLGSNFTMITVNTF